ncbi:hypothetical protein JBL43_16465 [Aureibaculum sp. A20]|uniref:DUF5103 domain-containing protein n=1 Tax=Aureibaculum flavum TaxID=2795986 RepID=A0ABS0WV29_9FLAO|nr:hypothetical protein [Aureibaculum flavum]MBJ2175849.1 hypothetical protein [Aureibaculum flavum]
MKYTFLIFLSVILFMSNKYNPSKKNELKNSTIDSIFTIDYRDFKVIRYLENEYLKSYDTLLFKSKIETNDFSFKIYNYDKAFFECYKKGNDVFISYNFLMENLFTKKKFLFHVYNNLGEINDVSKIEHFKNDISLSNWANKMLYINTNTKKDLHFTITNDTLKLLSDKKEERTLFFKTDTFIQKYDYNKIETISYFEDIDSLNAGFDERFINIVPVQKQDTILFRKMTIKNNEIYLKNKTYKITNDEYLEYYKTGDRIFSKHKYFFKNLTNNKEFSFYTYAKLGTSTGYNAPEQLDAYVGLSKKNDYTGRFTSTFGRKLDPFFIYFTIKNNSLIIDNLYSDQYYRNERMSFSLDTLINIEDNDLINIEKLWDIHSANKNRFYLNEYNTKHNLKPKANINVTPKFVHYPYNRKEPIPKEQLVFNLTFEDYGQCDFHQSFVINEQIDYQRGVRYNLTFNKEFNETIKIELDQTIIGTSHQIFTLKKIGKKIILENEFKSEDDSRVLLNIVFVFEKINKEYKLNEAYQNYNNQKHFSQFEFTDGVYINN